MIVSLNRNLNFAKFSMLPKNKAGQIQSSITFIKETLNEELDSEEVKKFMLWMDDSLEQVRGMVAPELLHMLQKLPAN